MQEPSIRPRPRAANDVPLTPVSFLKRAARVYGARTAVVHGDRRYDYREFHRRCRQLASALSSVGVGPGDTVSVLAPNIPALLEAHFAIPMLGAVLNAVNTRLDAATIAFILDHGEAKVFLVDRELAVVAAEALGRSSRRPMVIRIDDPLCEEPGAAIGDREYEEFVAAGDPGFVGPEPDEWSPLALNYTSGTTGNPKGALYHHRGAYLNAVGNVLSFGLDHRSTYLWTLPMFHCNGWTYPWAVTLAAGTHVCLRRVEPARIFAAIEREGVTHMCGAPVVLNLLIHAPDAVKRRFGHKVNVATGGAAPPTRVIAEMEKMGFQVTHLYGLTETFGPSMLCAWQAEWDDLPLEDRAGRMARQGVGYPTVEDVRVVDPETGGDVVADGRTIGELILRSNTIMSGYLKNRKATEEALGTGWLKTGDLAVMHPDGYAEVKDRAKDIIISGGENISSLEVEEVLYRHPDVMEAAVVARPDDRWGEVPCAFVALKEGRDGVTEEDVIAWCRDRMARFKAPKRVVFGPLPKTSTGKIQKFVLRERARQ